MSDLQKQLNERIKRLQKEGGSGLSEGLVRRIAEQEKIRRSLEAAKKRPGTDKGALQALIEKMKKTEADLLSKKVTQKTFDRQREIETRLLSYERATRSQEESPEREGERAAAYERHLPPEIRAFAQQSQQQLSAQKYKRLPLTPYYKEVVKRYMQWLQTAPGYVE